MLKSAMDYPLVPNRKNKEGWAAVHLAIMKRNPLYKLSRQTMDGVANGLIEYGVHVH